jgi:hypothetical protein
MAAESAMSPVASPRPASGDGGTTAVSRDAFMLGWEVVELRSRVAIALDEPVHFGLRLASSWRASFNRIAALQRKAFPASATAQTLYDPPSPEGLPYLYPPESDYANVGICGSDTDGAAILGNFKLYDVTRRAINCLTLLYLHEDEGLVPALIRQYQEHLVSVILTAAQNPDAGGGEEPATDGAHSPDGLRRARMVLTERTVKFLEAWEGYVRENYYLGGVIPNDNLELIAFEAGHLMSSLSWGVSAATVPLEQQAKGVPSNGAPPDDCEAFVKAWRNVFRAPVLIRLQHQITALSSELDDAYYLQHPEKGRPEDPGVLTTPDPDLPSQAIQAVKRSIDYWQRAVIWMAEHPDELRKSAPDKHWNTSLRLALIEQANVWQTLVTGQQSLRAYNLEALTHQILQDANDEILNSVRTDFKAGVKQGEQLMAELAAEVKDAIAAAGNAAAEGLNQLLRQSIRVFWPILAVVGTIAVVLLVVALLLPQIRDGAAAASGGAGLTAAISAVLGYFGWGSLKGVKETQQAVIEHHQAAAEKTVDDQSAAGAGAARSQQQEGGLLSRIEGASQETSAMVLNALDRGYKQIRLELDGLNRSVAITYPLVEFFGTAYELRSDMAFLTNIVWSGTEREAELKRVMSAAFGPLGLFISPRASAAGENGGNNRKAQIPVARIASARLPPADQIARGD